MKIGSLTQDMLYLCFPYLLHFTLHTLHTLHTLYNLQVRKGPFTPEEDAVILVAHEIHGNKWATISKLLPGR